MSKKNEKLLWKDFSKQESCDNCPLLEAEICPGGMTSYGGEPIEPPCWSFDDDTDLNQWVIDYFDNERRYEERESVRLKEEHKRKERAKKAAETRREMQWYCRKEIFELKQAKKALKVQENFERFIKSYAEATNFANDMFQYKEKVVVKPQISEEVNLLHKKIDNAKAALEVKRKEFYQRRKKNDN